MISEERLRAGAEELIGTCLAVVPADRVLILTDRATAPLAGRIAAAASARCGGVHELVLPDLDQAYDDAFARLAAGFAAHRPTVVVFAARDELDRLSWDERYWGLVESAGARCAQMTDLDEISLGVGLATDYREVARFTHAVTTWVSGTRRAHVADALGTDIVFALDPDRPWTPFTGLYPAPGDGGRLPQGETFCSPVDANGVIAAAVIGYPFNASTGLLADPVRFTIAGGRLSGVEHSDPDLAERLRLWFIRDSHAGRVGELAFGTNRSCTELIGNLLFDENVPGCHIALGHPFGDYTGAGWESQVHVDLVVRRPTVTLDGRVLMRDGEYVAAVGDATRPTRTENAHDPD